MSCQGLSGQKISGMPLCLSQYEVVACGTSAGCAPTPTRASDLTGQDWVFPSTCVPAGWHSSSSSGTRFDTCMGGAGGAGSGAAGANAAGSDTGGTAGTGGAG